MKAKVGQMEFEIIDENDVKIFLNIIKEREQDIEQKDIEQKEHLEAKKRIATAKISKKTMKGRLWTKEEDDIVINNFPKKAFSLLSGRTKAAINNRKMRLNTVLISKYKKSHEEKVSERFWTEKEDEIIKNNSPKKAKKFLPNRSMQAIYLRRIKLGISEEVAKKRKNVESSFEININKVKSVSEEMAKKRKKGKRWTKQEIEILMNNEPLQALKLLSNRDLKSIYDKRYNLGIKQNENSKMQE